jgi:murein DD-endopeptidase MepM/ murein hydrolase activator NlpD
MRQRRFSILVIPEDNGDVKRLQVTSNQLRIGMLCLSFFFIASLFLGLQYVIKARDTAALVRLRRENSSLWAQVAQLNSSVAEFQSQMSHLVEREKVLRTMADLKEIDTDVRKVGVGGHGIGHLEGSSYTLGGQVASPRFVLANLDHLLRQVRLEKQSFQEVETAFRENRKRLEHTPTIWPVSGYVSRDYGSCIDPFTGRRRLHEGVDIVNRVGTPVVATAAGKVVESGRKGGYGWTVVLDHGYGYRTAYGHLDEIKVNRGERVQRGQVIATLGNSGRSTGPHLHYEVQIDGRPVDPLKFILPDIVVD